MLKSLVLIIVLINYSWCSTFVFPTEDVGKEEGSECTTKGGLSGTCKKIVHCVNAKDKVSTDDLCSFASDAAIYCCPNAGGTGEPVSEKLLGLRPIEEICEYYYPRRDAPVYGFAGGIQSLVDQYPHMAAIGWANFDGGIDWRCGGTVVTSNFVITAAHCASSRGIAPTVVRTGDLNLVVTENNTFPEDFQITEIFVHPGYKSNEVYHDIALLKISPDFSKKGFVPACIWPKFDIPQTQGLIGMGYGTLEFSGPQSNMLFHGFLDLQSHEECVQKVTGSPSLPRGIIRGQLCAQDPKNVMDTCQGDSGGPLQFYFSIGYTYRPMLAGITSFGQNCAGSTPGVYTRVSEYVDWMEPILLSDFHNKTAISTAT